MKNIAIFASDTKSIVNFRMDLIKKLVDIGHKVYIICPNDKNSSYLKDTLPNGIEIKFVKINNNAISLINDIRLIIKLKKILDPCNILFSYHIKPVLYGGFIFRVLGEHKKFFPTITGLGRIYMATEGNVNPISLKSKIKLQIIRKLSDLFYSFVLKKADKVFFQNQDDMSEFVKLKLVDSKKSIILNGSGVNLDQYSHKIMPKQFSFIFAGRLMIEKGIFYYLSVSAKLKKKYKDVEFLIVGASCDKNIEKKIKIACIKHNLIFVGEVNDIRPYLDKSSVFVLPSYYREGIPRAGIEALSTGRPIITTSMVGCRELINKNETNGITISYNCEKILKELLIAMEHMINMSRGDILKMANESRIYAEKRFDVLDIVKEMISFN